MEIEHGLDVGMVELAEDESFAAKAPARGGVAQRLGVEHLDGDVALQSRVASTENDAHTARTDLLDEAEMAEGLPGGEGRRRHIDSRKRIV